jgi:hypothetical protein
MQYTRDSAHRSLFFSLLTLLYPALANGACAFDSPVSVAEQNGKGVSLETLLGEITTHVTYWSAHCLELEESKRKTDASQCWWNAAKAINRYTVGDHPLTVDVNQLRMDWLWRGVQLSLESLDVQPQPMRLDGPDLARFAGPVACSSIILSDYKRCLAAIPALGAPLKQHSQSHRKEVAIPGTATINKKKTAGPTGTKTKVATTPVLRKKLKKKIVEPLAMRKREVALPIVPKVQKRKNFTAYPRRENRNAAYSPRWWW